jgi:hypothetical protein
MFYWQSLYFLGLQMWLLCSVKTGKSQNLSELQVIKSIEETKTIFNHF